MKTTRRTFKEEFMNQLRQSKEELQQLTGKQAGAILLYIVCVILVHLGAQMIALKVYDTYVKIVRRLYERFNLDFNKHSLLHTVIATILAGFIIYAAAYGSGYLFSKYILAKAFNTEK